MFLNFFLSLWKIQSHMVRTYASIGMYLINNVQAARYRRINGQTVKLRINVCEFEDFLSYVIFSFEN